MAAVKKVKTRLARWIHTLRKTRYYDSFEAVFVTRLCSTSKDGDVVSVPTAV
jgi:hypothetical protein